MTDVEFQVVGRHRGSYGLPEAKVDFLGVDLPLADQVENPVWSLGVLPIRSPSIQTIIQGLCLEGD